MKSFANGTTLVIAAAAALAGFVGVSTYFERDSGGGAATATPAAFTEAATLDDAIARSAESGLPVFALATAEWCGPCQRLKKDTLSDEDVGRVLSANSVAVILDDATHRDDIRRLGVRAYPTSMIIKDGEVVGRFEGYAGAKTFMAFLDANLGTTD